MGLLPLGIKKYLRQDVITKTCRRICCWQKYSKCKIIRNIKNYNLYSVNK